MGHIDSRNAQCLLDPADFRTHLDPQLGIQVAQRFVKQQHAGFHHQRPCQRNTLLLSAGELVGHPLLHVRELHQLQDVCDPLLNLFLRNFPEPETVCHVVKHIVVREKRVALEHHCRIALVGRQLIDRFPAQVDLTLIRTFKAGDHPQCGRFSAAGRSEQRHKAAGLNLQRHVMHGIEILSRLGILIDFGYVIQADALRFFFIRCHITSPLP